MPSKILVVLGLKRGGTSVTAGILDKLGVHMGDRLPPPESWNPDGFFEDMDFVDLMNGLMPGMSVKKGKIVEGNVAPLAEFVRTRNSQHSLWGLKNFGLNYILPHFTELCDPSDVYVLRVLRPFGDAVESLTKRDHSTLVKALQEQSHLLYNTDKVYEAHEGRKMSFEYGELLANPAWVVWRITKWAGLTYRAEAAALVKPSLQHLGSGSYNERRSIRTGSRSGLLPTDLRGSLMSELGRS